MAQRRVQRIRYRVSQFWRGLNANVADKELHLVSIILPADALARLIRLPVDAQRHSLNVLHTVHIMGVHDPDLDAAALLHDVGKLAADAGDQPLNLWLRSLFVLMEAWSPETLHCMADSDPQSGIRYTAYVHLEHALIGAEWAKEDGCSDLTCWLVRHHQDALDNTYAEAYSLGLLNALQAADNAN